MEITNITVEEVEIGLALINTYRGLELDININETKWINENIKMSNVLGDNYKAYDEENILDVLAQALNMSSSNVRLLIREGLGIKRGTDYQCKQMKYIDCLIDDCKDGLYENLLDFMRLRKIDVFYKALLFYVKDRISTEPLSNDRNELTFYVIYDDLRKTLKFMGYTCGMSNTSLKKKLRLLCDLKLLRNIKDDEMTAKALHVANNFKENVSKTMSEDHGKSIKANRRNHYVLYDLSPQNQARAMGIVEIEKTFNLRQNNKTSTSLGLLHGENNGVVAQREANINETKLNNFINAANILLEKQDYYTEEQLRIQYCKKDKAIKKDDAIVLTAEYIAGVNFRVGAVRTRVNKKTREKYELPAKIKSNSIIYVKAD